MIKAELYLSLEKYDDDDIIELFKPLELPFLPVEGMWIDDHPVIKLVWHTTGWLQVWLSDEFLLYEEGTTREQLISEFTANGWILESMSEAYSVR